MSRKSIGQFIAALRKANGMTQKQLGEMLGVSDKAVSRWERDECAPDLSLIPVIAEIFSVTSDEILRGERIMQVDSACEPKDNMKTEKQAERILKSSETKFKVRSMISVGIAGSGILSAFIANFGFNRAYIGFFVGCIFTLAALVCESIFTYLSFSAVSCSDFELENITVFKKKIVDFSCRCFSLIFILFSFILPLIILPNDTFEGVWPSSLFFYGSICAAIAVILSALATWIIKLTASKKGLFTIHKAEKIRNTLRIKCTAICLILIAVTCIGQVWFNGFFGYTEFVKGEVFTDINEFKKYIETPKGPTYSYPNLSEALMVTRLNSDDNNSDNSDEIYYDTDTIEEDGKIICEFVHRNLNVRTYSYEHDKNNKLIITAYTTEDYEQGTDIIHAINYAFVVAYLAECICMIIVYNKKKRNIALNEG